MNKNQLRFTKGAGKTDKIEFLQDDRVILTLKNPKQGILPHDMVHFAIETNFPVFGFLQMMFRGYDSEKSLQILAEVSPVLDEDYPEAAWIAESLVESAQACLWSQEFNDKNFLYLYQKACQARSLTPVVWTPAQVNSCFTALRTLSSKWQNLEVGQSLSLHFEPRLA
jgi:hypothetical protein